MKVRLGFLWCLGALVSAQLGCGVFAVVSEDSQDVVDGENDEEKKDDEETPDTPEGPAIEVSLSLSPSVILAGESSTLSWSAEHADSCSIDQGIGTVALQGTQEVSPTSTTVYTLNCSTESKTASANGSLTVQSDGPIDPVDPGVHDFAASVSAIQPGQSATLSWQSQDMVDCTLNNNIGDVTSSDGSHSLVVTPSRTALYRLRCRDENWKYSEGEFLLKVDGRPRRLVLGGRGGFRWTVDFDFTKTNVQNPDPDFNLVEEIPDINCSFSGGDNEYNIRGLAHVYLPADHAEYPGAAAFLAVGGGTADTENSCGDGHDFQGVRWHRSVSGGSTWEDGGYHPWAWASGAIQGRDGTILAIGGGGIHSTSMDGENWSEASSITGSFGPNTRSVTFFADRFVVAGNNGSVYSTLDVTTWTDHSPTVHALLPELTSRVISRGAFSGGTLILASTPSGGLGPRVLRLEPQSDGVGLDIEVVTLPEEFGTGFVRDIHFGDGKFLMHQGSLQFVSSDGGKTFVFHQSNQNIQGLAYYGDGVFAGRSNTGFMYRSRKEGAGYHWDQVYDDVAPVAPANNRWMIFGGDGD